MNILLTGAAGFIAQHVAKRLQMMGHEVAGVDNLEPRVHHERPELAFPYEQRVYWETPHELLTADVVVHLAAQVGVADSMQDPFRYVRDNTWGTTKFMAALEYSHQSTGYPKRLVVASSMSVYGDPEQQTPVAEWKPVRPASVYGLTKYDQEQLCLLLGKQAGMETIALRLFNVYGPGQALHNPYTGVIANFAQRVLEGKPPVVYEDGEQTRDFVAVEDVSRAIAAAATRDLPAQPVLNVCTGRATTISRMAELVCRGLGRVDLLPTPNQVERPGDIRHCVGDPSLIHDWIRDWRPMRVERGIERYCEWLKHHV